MLNNLDLQKKRLVVIGGGAAGFFCAVNAARMNPQLEVIMLEKTAKVLSKVRISGGGRCNVTHACFDIDSIVKRYPRGANFVKKTFHHFFTTDTINWFNERQVGLKTEADGRMFPETNTSQTIVDCLMKEAEHYGVTIMMQSEVKQVQLATATAFLYQVHVNDAGDAGNTSITEQPRRFTLELSGATGKQILMAADYCCIACGGYPKTAMFSWITSMGHTVAPPVPSLFTFNMPENAITQLMGISVDNVTVKIYGTKLETSGPLLITHWGLSGPAILKLSAWGARLLSERNYAFTAMVNWLPAFNEKTLRDRFEELRFDIAAQKIYNKNPFGLPLRLWEYFMQQAGIKPELRWADLPIPQQNKLVKILCAQAFSIQGKTTFKEEFVTAGGIQLNEVDANTMMSKRLPGLYFAGEILDVDGVTGGFNFQHAWTSGWIAAKAISQAAQLIL